MSRMTTFAQIRSMRCHCLLPCYRRSRNKDRRICQKTSLHRLRTSFSHQRPFRLPRHLLWFPAKTRRRLPPGHGMGISARRFSVRLCQSPRSLAGMYQRAAFPAWTGTSSSDRQRLHRLDLRNLRRGCTSRSKRMLCAGMERRRDTACLYAGCAAVYVTSVLLSCYTHDIQMYWHALPYNIISRQQGQKTYHFTI